MKAFLPEYVETFVNIGLDTGEASDRYLALKAANHADMEPDQLSQLGLAVVGIFMEQEGFSFTPPTKRIDFQGRGDLLDRAEFLIRRELAQAIGDELGIESRFYELIGNIPDRPGSAGITEEGMVTDVNKWFSALKPYVCMQRYSNDWSRRNFITAAKAVKGSIGGESELEDFLLEEDTLMAIRGLAECPN